MTPDPYAASGGPRSPVSWNRYTYAIGDPANRTDPSGRYACDPEDPDCPIDECDPGDPCWTGNPQPDPCGPDPATALAGTCEGPPPEPPPAKTPPCPPQFQAWINSYGADAVTAGLPEANALALSAIETGWGTGRFATQGNDFFNLETCWAPGKPQPAFRYAYQAGWIQAQLPSDSCGKGLHYALVASYASVLNSFLSVAATFANLNVTNPAAFAKNAAADGIYAGNSPGFLTTQQTFVNCLTGQ
jgi:hypothetical protein